MNIDPEVIHAAQASAAKYGVPASVTLAQWALESGWGQWEAGSRNQPPERSFNPFGIKAAHGQPCVWIATHEVVRGERIEVQAPFRKFASLEEAFDAHARLLATNPAYDGAMKHTDNPGAFAMALTGHYATDPHYGDKLVSIMHGSANLLQYDAPPPSPSAPAARAA